MAWPAAVGSTLCLALTQVRGCEGLGSAGEAEQAANWAPLEEGLRLPLSLTVAQLVSKLHTLSLT